MYALLDFGKIRLEKITEFSKIKAFYNNNPINIEKIYKHISVKKESINYFFQGIIKTCAFCDCNDLLNVKIPENTEVISEYAFYGCKKLKMVELPERLKKIEINAFARCYYLNTINIPQNIIYIGNGALYACNELMNINYAGINYSDDNLLIKTMKSNNVNITYDVFLNEI